MSAQHDLQMAGQVFLAERFSDASNPLTFFAGNLQQSRPLTCDLGNRGVAQEAHHLPSKMGRAVTFADQMIHSSQNVFARAARYRVHHFFENVRRSRPHQVANRIDRKLSAGRSNGLVENRKCVTHGSVAGLGQQSESVIVSLNILAVGEVAQLAHDVVELHGAKTEVLAARANGLGNVLGLRGGQHENHMIRRLLQRFQQGVEGGIGDLMSFVENVDFETVTCRTVAGAFAQFANLVNAAVGGGIDLDYIDGISGADLSAGFADATRLQHGLFRGAAVQRHGQNARHGRLANATMSAEDVAVSGSALLDGVLQSTGNVLLADDVGELLRPVFTCQDGIAHGDETLIIRDRLGRPQGSPGAKPCIAEDAGERARGRLEIRFNRSSLPTAYLTGDSGDYEGLAKLPPTREASASNLWRAWWCGFKPIPRK